jgi:hypothetical protein
VTVGGLGLAGGGLLLLEQAALAVMTAAMIPTVWNDHTRFLISRPPIIRKLVYETGLLTALPSAVPHPLWFSFTNTGAISRITTNTENMACGLRACQLAAFGGASMTPAWQARLRSQQIGRGSSRPDRRRAGSRPRAGPPSFRIEDGGVREWELPPMDVVGVWWAEIRAP